MPASLSRSTERSISAGDFFTTQRGIGSRRQRHIAKAVAVSSQFALFSRRHGIGGRGVGNEDVASELGVVGQVAHHAGDQHIGLADHASSVQLRSEPSSQTGRCEASCRSGSASPKYFLAVLSEITDRFRLSQHGGADRPAISGSRMIWKKLGSTTSTLSEKLAVARSSPSCLPRQRWVSPRSLRESGRASPPGIGEGGAGPP